MNFKEPVFFLPNRVWRAYIGGKLMDEFVTDQSTGDGHFPEDWLASTTAAMNYANSQHPEEGLTRVKNPDGGQGELFKDLLKKHPLEMVGNPAGELGVLCKYLDSAIRLPLQCHPDKDFAKQYYDSSNGKTESWFILATRQINDEDPYLLMGFKEGVNADDFKKAVIAQDITAMENSMHKIAVKPGDQYFIPGRLPHAIGAGVLLLEVQEPTDWVVQPERFLGDTELSYPEMYGKLTVDDALKCFDYDSQAPLEKIIERCKLVSKIVLQNESGTLSEVIGPDITDCFNVYELAINNDGQINLDNWAIAVVTDGAAKINSNEIKRGDYFFIPYGADALTYQIKSKLSLYLICDQSLTAKF